MSDVRTLDVSALPPGAFGSRTRDVLGHARDRRRSRAPSSPWPSVRTCSSSRDFRHGRRTALPLPSCAGGRSTRSSSSEVWFPTNWRDGPASTSILAASGSGWSSVWSSPSAFNIVRVFEFAHLNVMWDHDAYGSIVWLLLGLHTTHIVTDFLDSGVLTALMFTGPIEEHRFVDVEENAVYWYFVVLAWLPIYGVIYWAPRLL